MLAAYKLPQNDGAEIQWLAMPRFRLLCAVRRRCRWKWQCRTVAHVERIVQLEAIAAASMKSDLDVARLMAAAGAKGALANVIEIISTESKMQGT